MGVFKVNEKITSVIIPEGLVVAWPLANGSLCMVKCSWIADYDDRFECFI
jgi:hypothetical protein